MAHPLFIMEQALRQFSSQWYAGFRPSLEIQTKYDEVWWCTLSHSAATDFNVGY